MAHYTSDDTVTLTFNENMAVTDDTGVLVQLNGAGVTIATGISAAGVDIAITSITALVATDFVKVSFNAGTGNIADLAGNKAASMLFYIGGSGDNTIDATSDVGSVIIKGNGGDDTLTDSAQIDVIIGGAGGDAISLVNGGNDVVAFTAATDGSAAGINTGFDTITNFTISGGDKIQFGGTLFTALNDSSSGTITTMARGQSEVNAGADEMVFLSTALTATVFADADFVTFRTAIGAVSTGFTAGAEVLVVANDGTNTGIYLITSVNGNTVVDANEVQLLGTVNSTLAPGDFILTSLGQ